MAVDITGVDKQIKDLKNQLDSSSTAGSNNAYTQDDVSADYKLRGLEKLKSTMLSNQAKQQWYSETQPTKVDKNAKPDAGLIASGLDALQRPLRAVVGGVKAITGKSGGKGILASANSNMDNEKDDFSSLLKQMNLPTPVAAGLGFALDMSLDPLSWVTLGGGAGVAKLGKGASRIGELGTVGLNMEKAVPRMIYGAAKAGPEGAAAAVKSSFWDTASTIAKFIPGSSKDKVFRNWTSAIEKAGISSTPEVKQITKDMLLGASNGDSFANSLNKAVAKSGLGGDMSIKGAVEEANLPGRLGKIASKIDEFKVNTNTKATAAKNVYEGTLGFKPGELIDNIVTSNANRMKWSDVVRNEISNLSGGNKALDLFNYDPKQWYRVAKIKDELWKAYEEVDDLKVAKSLTDDKMRKAAIAESVKAAEEGFARAQQASNGDLYSKLKMLSQDGEDIVKNKFSDTVVDRLADKAVVLASEGHDQMDVMQAYKELIKGTAEGDWVDTAINKMQKSIRDNWTVGSIKAGEKLMDAYENIYKTYIGIFKSTKVGGKFVSPAAHVNSWMGNPIMAHMVGIDVTRSGYLNTLKDAYRFYKGKNTAEYAQRVLGGKIEDYARDYPGLFTGMYGFTPNKIKLLRDIDEELALRVKAGQMAASDAQAAKVQFSQHLEDIGEVTADEAAAMRSGANLQEATAVGETASAVKAAQSTVKPGNALSGAKDADMQEIVDRSGFGSASYIGNELTDPQITKLRNNIKLRAEMSSGPEKTMYQMFDYVLNKGPQEYEVIDQSNRLGLFTHLVNNGLTEPELMRVSKVINLNPATDLVRSMEKGKEVFKFADLNKANELVSITYLNYAAMPAFVRAMRSAPIVGSPFFSFTYGMGSKVAQT
ncbi:MAG: hypothetical protein NTW48_08865, partial [Chloroflexi bacterium]|nr:hypothetical protein [Chloroflexota bacterium]